MSTKRTSYSSGTHWEAMAGYSRAVRIGDQIHVSGTTATGPDGLVGGDDPAAQTHFIIDKIENAIIQLGGQLTDIVRTRVFISDVAHWEPVARATANALAISVPQIRWSKLDWSARNIWSKLRPKRWSGPAMRFSLRLNNDLHLQEYVALAQAAEAAGFDQIWVSNDLFLRSAPVILTAIAQATSRIHFGAGILNPYTINPGELAMLAATLDELSDNRFNLGLAAGAGDFLAWVGLEQQRPLAALRESITAIRRLLVGERAGIDGAFLKWTSDAYLRFQAPRITPIYVGAMGPKMLALAGEMADGVLPLLFPPEHYFGVKPYLEAGIKQRDGALDELDFAACIWVSLAQDESAARRELAQKIAYYGYALGPLILARLGLDRTDFAPIQQAIVAEQDEEKAISLVDERMLRIGVVGGPKDVIERLEPLVADGAQHLSFGPPLGPDRLEAVRLLGQVIEHFG